MAMTGMRTAQRGPVTPGAVAPRVRKDTGRSPGQSGWWALLFVGPVGIGLAIFYLWPIVRTIWMSFTETGPFGGSSWTGLSNYQTLFSNPDLPQALLNTLLYTLVTLLVIPIAMVIAALMNTAGLKGQGIYRTLYFLPVVTMAAAVAAVWQVIYNGDYGVLNQVLHVFGITGTSWLTNPATVLPAIAAVGVWSTLGTTLVIFLAALQGVPTHLYEAAELDGAGPIRRFISVTIPMISPSVFFVTVTTVIGAFQAFDLIYVMVSKTSPALPHVKTVVYLFYEAGFVEHNQGLAAAIAFVLLILILIITVVQFSLQRKWVHYE